jgi:hypothetical protein
MNPLSAEDLRPTPSADWGASEVFITATDGALVIQVVPDSVAAKAGIGEGDIVTSIGGMAVGADLDLVAAKAQLAGQAEVELVWTSVCAQGEAKSQSITLNPSEQIGIATRPTQKAEVIRQVPERTHDWSAVDFSSLADGKPHITWMKFLIAGEHVGYEANAFWMENGELMQLAEVSFASEQWGEQHFVVTNRFEVTDDGPVLKGATYEGPLWNWSMSAAYGDGWTVTRPAQEDGSGTTTDTPDWPTNVIPDYLPIWLGPYLPKENGLTLHYPMLMNMALEPGPYTALRLQAHDPEETLPGPLPTGTQVADLWSLDLHSHGNRGVRMWFVPGELSPALALFGGNTVAVTSTRAEALDGVKASIQPARLQQWNDLEEKMATP